MPLHELRVVALQPQGIAGEVGIDREAAVLQALRPKALHEEADHFGQPEGQFHGLVVGADALLHGGAAVAPAGHRGGVEFGLNQIQQPLAARIAHGDPLATEFGTHVAHHQVRAGIGVVEAAQTAGGKHILEGGGVQAEEGHRLRAAVGMAEVDAEILHELVMDHRIGRAAGAVQEGLQTLATHVVDTGQTQHIELIESKGGFHGAQSLHLATHADGKQAADSAARKLLKHPQVGGEGGLVHPGR